MGERRFHRPYLTCLLVQPGCTNKWLIAIQSNAASRITIGATMSVQTESMDTRRVEVEYGVPILQNRVFNARLHELVEIYSKKFLKLHLG